MIAGHLLNAEKSLDSGRDSLSIVDFIECASEVFRTGKAHKEWKKYELLIFFLHKIGVLDLEGRVVWNKVHELRGWEIS